MAWDVLSRDVLSGSVGENIARRADKNDTCTDRSRQMYNPHKGV